MNCLSMQMSGNPANGVAYKGATVLDSKFS